jgi:hypothetical protein
MAYTLDARGEGIIIPEGVQTHVPIDADGRGPAFFDGRMYMYSQSEFPEEAELKALRNQHRQWIKDQQAGGVLGPQPRLPDELVNDLLNRGREAATALRAAGPQ